MIQRHAMGGPSVVRLIILLIGVMLSINILRTECKKELPFHAAFPQKLLDAVSCDVCSHALANLAKQVQAVSEEKKSQSLNLSEENILEIMEDLCVPFDARGNWMRRVALKIPCSPFVGNDESGGSESKSCTEVLNFSTACKRTCRTIEEACVAVMNDEGMDRLSALLLKKSQESVNITELEFIEKMIREVCGPLSFCSNHKEYRERLERDLNITTVHGTLFEQILLDKTEKIEEGDLNWESMLYSTRDDPARQPVLFTKEDMDRLTEAYKTRNLEMAKEVDPGTADLSDKEFEELHHVAKEEHGDM